MTTASTWHMPAETEKQARTWMAWPVADYGTPAEEARRAWSAVANAITQHGGQPVTMLVTAEEEPYARKLLDDEVTLLVTRLDDGWARDTGPTFVVDAQRTRLGAVDWVFNAWGAQSWASWAWDARVATTIAEEVGAEIIPSEMVAEGGGFHTDGHPGRRPAAVRAGRRRPLHHPAGAGHQLGAPAQSPESGGRR
ncbi:agmatine deiminase family protein [Kitasatospora sp. NPDC048298]|uniref:agmatine deiminase family protein n=1 Tax=Kitasatospora sp. NPDC048298 TaxID=3364049 RepID=UPI00371A196F